MNSSIVSGSTTNTSAAASLPVLPSRSVPALTLRTLQGIALLLLAVATAAAQTPPTSPEASREEAPKASDPTRFFQAHFFPHEPFYFIAGIESPNAKFQISFKYQLFTGAGWLAEHIHPLTNFYLGYSQTSLWDWNKPSAPFFDSSYRPELLYWMPQVDKGKWADWLRLDLQGGVQHESNGRDEDFSRSLNIVYVKPTVFFGKPDGFQLSLAPRAWVYVGDVVDNPDIKDYRGYFDVRTVIGWQDHAQLAATGRVGDDFDHASLQLDFTYPLWEVPLVRSSLFFHVQYFIGYGESLLLYNKRGSSIRAGFALFR
jgi:outer membrane phospholipase A